MIRFLVLSFFLVNAVFFGEESKSEGIKNICFHEKSMSEGVVCVYKAKSDPSGCKECQKKKNK